jgi:hypothetical protein
MSMSARKILVICGTLSQTKAMLKIGAQLGEHQCFYTPFYCDGHLLNASKKGWLDFTAVAGPLRQRTMQHLIDAGVPIDDRGEGHRYDIVVTCTDLIIQQNIKGKRIVLVQEGLTEPEGIVYLMVKYLGVPRVFANTAAFGLSDAYEVFCVASPGSRDLFAAKGVRPQKMVLTGIPNFDDARQYLANDFPHRDFVLVCTSNARETFKRDNRKRYLRRAIAIAAGRPIVFKLHPAERHDRAIDEIRALMPDAHILRDGNTEHMIANCSALVAQYSTVAFTAAALGKEVHSYIHPNVLRQILPIQNGGTSAMHIAEVVRGCLEKSPARLDRVRAMAPPPAALQAFPIDNVRLMPR